MFYQREYILTAPLKPTHKSSSFDVKVMQFVYYSTGSRT